MEQRHGWMLAAAALCCASSAQAETVLGGGAGWMQSEFSSSLDQGQGFSGFVGYRFERLPILVEVEYLDSGDMDYRSPAGASLRFAGANASIGFVIDTLPRGLQLWGRGGMYDGTSTFQTATGDTERDSQGASLAFGIGWMFLPAVGLRAEYQQLYGVRDFAGSTDHEGDFDRASVGLQIALGGRRAPARSAAAAPPPADEPAPASAPEAAPAEAAPPAPPAVAEPPPAQPDPSLVAGQTVALKPGAVVRQRPLAAAPAIATAAPAQVRLEARRINIEGVWWFVSVERDVGWVMESEVVAPN